MTNAQQELDDEILSACHDGELPPTEADAVRRRVAREPELAERLSAMRCVDEAAVRAFCALDGRPVPAPVLELLNGAEAEHRERGMGTDNVIPLHKPVPDRRPLARRWPVAIAASVALGIGFAMGALLPYEPAAAGHAFAGQQACEAGAE